MAIEIERKFLVFKDKLPPLEKGEHYVQGYLSIKPQVRFRMDGEKVTIAIKNKTEGNRFRYEWEFSNVNINKLERDEIIKLAVCRPIEKIRYKINYQNLVWEIDVYQGENEGLITADVELPTVDSFIDFPEWIDQKSEVGGDSRYFNVNLGDHPFKEWKKK